MADAALAATALLMGLAGGPHCAAMCGAAQAGLTAQGGARAVVALQLGRLASPLAGLFGFVFEGSPISDELRNDGRIFRVASVTALCASP